MGFCRTRFIDRSGTAPCVFSDVMKNSNGGISHLYSLAVLIDRAVSDQMVDIETGELKNCEFFRDGICEASNLNIYHRCTNIELSSENMIRKIGKNIISLSNRVNSIIRNPQYWCKNAAVLGLQREMALLQCKQAAISDDITYIRRTSLKQRLEKSKQR